MIKCFIVAVILASIIFLIIDVVWLSFATKSFYRPLLGDLISDKPVLWAAGLFYVLYMFGMAAIVIQPCIDSNGLTKSLYTGFIFGLVAYGTYNLTNMAVIKDWSPTVVFVDMFWRTKMAGNKCWGKKLLLECSVMAHSLPKMLVVIS